jgi:amino acid permease
MNKKTWIVLAVLLGVIFIIIGAVYATHSADMLPHFFPGYTPGDSLRHTKHALAAFIVAIACFIVAWFQSGPKKA